MSVKKKILRAAFAVFCMVSMLFIFKNQSVRGHAASSMEFVLLNTYSKNMKIGDECYLLAVTLQRRQVR